MDLITELPDDLLLRILSSVQTKTVFDAQLLSKRWRNLWRVLPSLYYDSASHKSESNFSVFARRTMELLESPVLDSLYLRVAPTETSSLNFLRKDLLAKRLRELNIVSTTSGWMKLTKVIYQFEALVILRFEGVSLDDDCGEPNLLKSLRVLKLCRVKYSTDVSLSTMLSNLPSLDDLTLDRCWSSKPATTLSVAVPCLQRLTLLRCPDSSKNHLMMLNVIAPSLEYLKVEDYWRKVYFSDNKKMEKLVEAHVSLVFVDSEKLLRAVKSAKRLSLCLLTSKVPRVNNLFFDQLVRLEICTCQPEWWYLLQRFLLDSPKLRVLKLHQEEHIFGLIDPAIRWKEPSLVPECFDSHLETFEWRGYEGTEDEKGLASYILRNARRLKTATIYPLISHADKKTQMILKNVMRRELVDLSGCAFTCKLVFK